MKKNKKFSCGLGLLAVLLGLFSALVDSSKKY